MPTKSTLSLHSTDSRHGNHDPRRGHRRARHVLWSLVAADVHRRRHGTTCGLGPRGTLGDHARAATEAVPVYRPDGAAGVVDRAAWRLRGVSPVPRAPARRADGPE